MTKHLNKDTTICMSLAARPSNFGTRFHNYLYDAMDLDYLYKAFTTRDLKAAIGGVRALGIRGCAISMPFKEECIPMLDELDASAKAINSVNTIVNNDGYLKAYNTDYIAIATLLKQYQVPTDFTFALRGSGGMAKAVACALKDAGFNKGVIVAKNEKTGPELASLYGFEWRKEMGNLNADLLINATPIGMANGEDANKLSFTEQQIEQAQVIFEVVALPAETPLLTYAKSKNKAVITGAEVFAIQAVEQFVLYTGVRPDDELFQQAAHYARAGA
ncbi:shikimate 5-dehydrogenase [Rouxiella badensis]|jgi:shikimate dehydrogenase|uniref:Shikimate 5-dehydrogenase n=1 Tax=Rouxiella badensis TaxID=1646377 RepID=A0A1X0W9H8_9GAMM|nr:shikimate 5-dehydrogenase [Rouxiella badensis]MCC3718992.1 shikimate 5-dehydrogenase [Rouxiella badensis]MCC3729046.1 shikimate 5-dehydrogenase [Rouxiella badensis]MCC3733579.1 shikimate 5-dehydrogenase [Rouxiella badensis]MCC3740597.1 shikimate 5-dehydrogenase [Rouxiella badensis]MCC3748545.1 shikimate 5-dehydrogenase [Rouxiella badensis]